MKPQLLLRARESNNSGSAAGPRNINHFRDTGPIDGPARRRSPAATGQAGAIFQRHAEKWRWQVDRLGRRAVTICPPGLMNDDRVPKDSSAPEGEKQSNPPAPKTSGTEGAAPRAASAAPGSGASGNKRTLIGIPAPSV